MAVSEMRAGVNDLEGRVNAGNLGGGKWVVDGHGSQASPWRATVGPGELSFRGHGEVAGVVQLRTAIEQSGSNLKLELFLKRDESSFLSQ